MKAKTVIMLSLGTGLAIALLLGLFLLPDVPQPPPPRDAPLPFQVPSARVPAPGESEWIPLAAASEDATEDPFPDWPADAVPDELLFSFASARDMEAFLREAARRGISGIEVLRELLTVRIRLGHSSEARGLRDLAGSGAFMAFNSFVLAPDPVPPLDEGVGGHRPFRTGFASWLGVPPDNADWGKGIRIAVLDTGIGDHSDLAGRVALRRDLVTAPGAAPGAGTHGTAVASLITGHGEVQGMAPAAELLDIRVLDANGVGDAFTLARGIVEAVQQNAPIINISLGAYGDSPVLREAVSFAHSHGVLVVAAVGNDNADRLLTPAAYPDVVGVGSIDANRFHAPFSNRGEGITIGTPGVGLAVASPEGGSVFFNGTSGSTPIFSGAVAGIASQNPGMSLWEAAEVVIAHADDTGPPGPDPYLGAGSLNIERALERDQPGIHDIAVASQFLGEVRPDGLVPLVVTVQNTGTESLNSVQLDVAAGALRQTYYLSGMEPREVRAVELLVESSEIARQGRLRVVSEATLLHREDVRPDNNTRISEFRPREPNP